jgi:hypothetical protein
MSEPPPPPPSSNGRPIPLRAAIVLLLGLRRGIREQRKLASPEIVVLNDPASRISKQAEEFAIAGRLDEKAAAELRRLAGRSRHGLTDALQHFRARELHLEWRHYNRSVRLLEAAINNTAVAPEAPAVTGRLDQLARLLSLDAEVAFAELAAREPRLAALRDTAAALPVKRLPHSLEDMREYSRTMHPLFEALQSLVGRKRADHDPVLSTETASGICSAYLRSLRYSAEPPEGDAPPAAR